MNSILSVNDQNFIDKQMSNNGELTSSELQNRLIEERGVSVSSATVRNVRRKMGWKHDRARYCKIIREPNKIKRLSFCLKALRDKDPFEDAIFTDETSVEIQQFTRYCFRKGGSLPKHKGHPKHPLKVS